MKRVGVLSGAFNPATLAHLALAEAALAAVDEVVCVVPRAYPHKQFHGASLEDRIEMLHLAGGPYRVVTTEGGLFIDIAHELKQPGVDLYFICGKDAAERVIHWDYGAPGAIEKMLDDFSLLVAARNGTYDPPAHLRDRVHPLAVERDLTDISSTEVRRRIASGEPWEHLVPSKIVDRVRRIYAA